MYGEHFKGKWKLLYTYIYLYIFILYKQLSPRKQPIDYQLKTIDISHSCIDILELIPSSTATTYRLTGINLLPSFVIPNYSQGITINTVRLTTRTGLPIPLSFSFSHSYFLFLPPSLSSHNCPSLIVCLLWRCVFVVDNVQSMSNDVVVILAPDPSQLRLLSLLTTTVAACLFSVLPFANLGQPPSHLPTIIFQRLLDRSFSSCRAEAA